ncbi:MAG TPA: NAD(P)-dependent oxidoreductase [Patescibacteria group bacterium]|nr:NAD(P)-dependent oxidoreductase [Patescibacteria group bacterium]
MNRKILILGSHGTLGQVLTAEFGKDGNIVTGWDRDELDITSNEAETKIAELNPDIIINATAYNATDPMQIDPEAKKVGFLMNSEVPGKLAGIAKKVDAIFIHYSTDYVFDGTKKDGYVETDMPNPISVYGESKYEGEKNAQKFDEKYYIIRLSRLFGEKGSSELSKRSFVEIMRGEIDKPKLMVKNEEVGSPTYAPDAAKFTKDLVDSNSPYGIYHGTNSGSCTWYEWAEEIFKDLGHGPKLIEGHAKDYNNPAPHPQFSILLNTKRPSQRSWQEALSEFLQNK